MKRVGLDMGGLLRVFILLFKVLRHLIFFANETNLIRVEGSNLQQQQRGYLFIKPNICIVAIQHHLYHAQASATQQQYKVSEIDLN